MKALINDQWVVLWGSENGYILKGLAAVEHNTTLIRGSVSIQPLASELLLVCFIDQRWYSTMVIA